MKPFRFSPIQNKNQLLEAIKYTHLTCQELCKRNFGKYLTPAGNIGIFSHYEDEYEFLLKLRRELTEESDNWNKKYYRLREPITIRAEGNIPESIYTYLYIRRPDPNKPQVGDVDFVAGKREYAELKKSLLGGVEIKGVKILDRPNLDLIELFDSSFDVLSFLGTKNMEENVV